MYLSYPKMYRTVTLIYRTFLKRNRQALDRQTDRQHLACCLFSYCSLYCSRSTSENPFIYIKQFNYSRFLHKEFFIAGMLNVLFVNCAILNLKILISWHESSLYYPIGVPSLCSCFYLKKDLCACKIVNICIICFLEQLEITSSFGLCKGSQF